MVSPIIYLLIYSFNLEIILKKMFAPKHTTYSALFRSAIYRSKDVNPFDTTSTDCDFLWDYCIK